MLRIFYQLLANRCGCRTMKFKKVFWIWKRWIFGTGILLFLSTFLFISRQRTWMSQHMYTTSSPHRIPFSDRAEFYTAGDREVIHRVEGMLRTQADTGQEFALDVKNKALASLSSIIQKQLAKQLDVNSVNCSGPTLICGHHQDCGFACQIHHRMTCVALSYIIGYPLIHDEVTGWGFHKKWSAAFQPIGSKCSVGPNTITVYWSAEGPRLTKSRACFSCGQEIVPSFIQDGFIVPQEIGELVDKLHGRPFLWWAGQFATFTLRLTQNQARILNSSKTSIGLSETIHPTFGLHVRRTDKITEDKDSRHSIDVYFSKIDEFIRDNNFLKDDLNQITFVASDESTVLGEAKKAYPRRRVLGFSTNKTLQSQKERVDALDDIIRDTLVLAESDYIVCGLSSNVCRLLLELMSARMSDSLDRLKSLDGKYRYHIYGLVSKQNVTWYSRLPNVVRVSS